MIETYRIDGTLLRKLQIYGHAGENTIPLSADKTPGLSIPAGMFIVSLNCREGATVLKVSLIK